MRGRGTKHPPCTPTGPNKCQRWCHQPATPPCTDHPASFPMRQDCHSSTLLALMSGWFLCGPLWLLPYQAISHRRWTRVQPALYSSKPIDVGDALSFAASQGYKGGGVLWVGRASRILTDRVLNPPEPSPPFPLPSRLSQAQTMSSSTCAARGETVSPKRQVRVMYASTKC